jgi:hypothetical protein
MLSVRTDPRLAGEVERYHTWPHNRDQSVGEHSWQVGRIILCVVPSYFWQRLLPYAILHDMGELGTGDIPYPIKKDNPELALIMDKLEHDTIKSMAKEWNLPTPVSLSLYERWMFKLCEFIEMWEWALEEQMRGNLMAKTVEERCSMAIVTYLTSPDSIREVVDQANTYIKRRKMQWGTDVS